MGLARVEQLNLTLSAGAVAASYAFATPHFAASLAAGAAMEAINLGAIHRAGKRLFSGAMWTGGWVGVLAMRLTILGFAIYAAMRLGAHPVALVIGLSITMPSTLIDAWLNRPPIIDPAELPTFLEDFDDFDVADEAAYAIGSDAEINPEVLAQDDRLGERLWSTGHLLTSMPIAEVSGNATPETATEAVDSVAASATPVKNEFAAARASQHGHQERTR